jgi:hypothetical protein
VKVFTSLQPGPGWVVSNVMAIVIEPICTTHEVVELILLPESSASPELLVQFRRRVVLPRVALREQRFLGRKCDKHVNVIGHNDEIGDDISLFVEMQQALSDDGTEPRLSEYALTMTLV